MESLRIQDYQVEMMKIAHNIEKYKAEQNDEALHEYLDDKLSLAIYWKHNPLIDMISKHIKAVGDTAKEFLDNELVFKNNDNGRRMIYQIINKNLAANMYQTVKIRVMSFVNIFFPG